MPSSSKRKAKLKDQFHHVIPRFILREFKIGPKKSKLERDKEFNQSGSVDEKIWFYDVERGILEPRLISQVFGAKNLYRDVRSIKDVNEIEKKLAVLETAVACILHNLHRLIQDDSESTTSPSPTPPTFSIIREDLEKLRKFLFIMHYRHEAHAKSYFAASHPDNADIRERIVRTNKKLGLDLSSPAEMWLHYMRYYLDTPHSQIGVDALQGQPGASKPNTLTGYPTVDSDSDNFEAMTYHTQASYYFLGIVQAAPGEEFILGHNTFGLWEGMIAGEPGVHRLSVISPQIAMILRLNFYRPEKNMLEPWTHLRRITLSSLLNIPLDPPQSIARRDFPLDPGRVFNYQEYKTSKDAKRDQYNFRVTRLTKEQTYAINAVVLLNAHKAGGSVTFASPERTRLTLQKFWADSDPNNRRERHKYEPLMHKLSSMSKSDPGPSSDDSESGDSDDIVDLITSGILIHVTRLGASEATPAELHYRHMRMLWKLCATITREEAMSSPFVFHFVTQYRQKLDETIRRIAIWADILSPPRPGKLRSAVRCKLVHDLSNEDAKTLFTVMDRLLVELGITTVPESGGPSNLYSAAAQAELPKEALKVAVLVEDVVIMGLLTWLVDNRRRYLDELMEGARIYCETRF